MGRIVPILGLWSVMSILPVSATVYDATLDRVIDGDTVALHVKVWPNLTLSDNFRLLGVDTAELRTKDHCEKEMAQIAKNWLSRILSEATNIRVKPVEKDKYGRWLGVIYVDAKNINLYLINKHLGVPYDGGKHYNVDWCKVRLQYQGEK